VIEVLHDRIDAFFRAATEAQPAAFSCAPGCDACCRVDLAVFPVEAARVRAAFQALTAQARRDAAARARAGKHCAMLDGAGRCRVYGARPAICRSHGLAILVDGRLDACPKNYRDEAPRRPHVLDIETLNEAIVRVDAAFGGRGERVRLADIAVEEDGEAR
jgi:Fe-S-cluster containining protein